MIILYNILNILLFPFICLILLARILNKKDNFYSVMQRLGLNYTKKSEQQKAKYLIWFHAASVGEIIVVINLIREIKLTEPETEFLVTSTTLSSAEILKKSKQENVTHQFMPLDNIFITRRFLQYWKPDLGIFIESELWPCLISQAANRFNLLSINARISDKSYQKWRNYPKIFNKINSYFRVIAVQSESDLKKYHHLKVKQAFNIGNLKFNNSKLSINQKDLIKLRELFTDQLIFVAASTHPEDEIIILDVINQLKKFELNYYPIIVPRHPNRCNDIKQSCQKLALSFSVRSENKLPSLNEDLYIADSFGELGLFYNLADISFIGGSFKHGGHNILEPAQFNNLIITGPDTSNLKNITEHMLTDNALIKIEDKLELLEKLIFFLDPKNKSHLISIQNNAKKFIQGEEKILAQYLQIIRKYRQ